MLNKNSNSDRGVYNSPLIVPCTYRKAIPHPEFPESHSYIVTLYLLVEVHSSGSLVTHTFLHESDQRENYRLARELGICVDTCRSHIFVSEHRFTDLYNQIVNYENVLKSNSHSE